MVRQNADNDLKASLDAVETSLATPVVSGELAEWLDTVQKTWAEASAQIHFQVTQAHARQYEQISKADPELLPRVEQLQAEDQAIEQQRNQLSQSVRRTAQHAPKLEPDEEKALQHIRKLVDDGAALIARVRKQEVAIQTWFVEAFNRDRGAGD
jgi:hypothetical protein